MIKKLLRPHTFFIAGMGIAALFVVLFAEQHGKRASAQIESSLIQPMLFENAQIDIFSAYGSWHSSDVFKTTDALGQALFAMGFEDDYKTPQSAFDINGDGLVDIIRHVRQNYSSNQSQFAIFLNKGNMQFDLAYKCLIDPYNTLIYYGDCAK